MKLGSCVAVMKIAKGSYTDQIRATIDAMRTVAVTAKV
jgi:hypothetical protein